MYKGERFNTISHLLGASLALAGGAVLVTFAAIDGDPYRIVSYSVYGATLFALYLVSCLYHGTPGPSKRVFRVLDYQAIYLLIAGTYTPFTLVALKGPLGWWMFGAIWGLAIFGVILEVLPRRGPRIVPLIIYLAMGWLCLFALDPIIAALPPAGFYWLRGGRHLLHLRASCSSSSTTGTPGATGSGICSYSPAASVTTSRFCSCRM